MSPFKRIDFEEARDYVKSGWSPLHTYEGIYSFIPKFGLTGFVELIEDGELEELVGDHDYDDPMWNIDSHLELPQSYVIGQANRKLFMMDMEDCVRFQAATYVDREGSAFGYDRATAVEIELELDVMDPDGEKEGEGYVLRAETDAGDDYYVIQGNSLPTNLYPAEKFRTPEEVVEAHEKLQHAMEDTDNSRGE